ncbi:unnamed protein product [Wuchereria bancrofti]|uniref:Uncharacterized protein n=1 Tax=Wuchereria bancrofti TaxID=6293 RepID=A0A3P7ECA7_WUCBA|nr:unnamed protein product [Wuchereria bancrofti]
MTVRRPFVYWAQDERLLFLTIDLKDSSVRSYLFISFLPLYTKL